MHDVLYPMTYEQAATIKELRFIDSELTDASDLVHFSNLETLYIIGSKLKDLDVSHNKLLTTLICHSNALSYLDVSQNVYLEELNCSSNSMRYLNLQNNSSLKFLSFSENHLVEVTLPDPEFSPLWYLNCSKNYLRGVLDVSGYVYLESLECYNNFFEDIIISEDNKIWGLVYTVSNVPDERLEDWSRIIGRLHISGNH